MWNRKCANVTRRYRKNWSTTSSDGPLAAQKTTHPTVLRCRGNVFTEQMPSNDKGIYRLIESLSYDTNRVENDPCNNSAIVVFIFCRGNVFVEPLFSNVWGYTYRDRLMRGMNKVCRWDGLNCHDINTKFYKDWFRLSDRHTWSKLIS
jgi:hypothetical protein